MDLLGINANITHVKMDAVVMEIVEMVNVFVILNILELIAQSKFVQMTVVDMDNVRIKELVFVIQCLKV
jgi:hypothetical protein